MKTAFHRKLESLCRISHRGDKHWLLVRSSLVRVPSQGGLIVTVKRAVYAAYIGPVLEGQDVVALCGLRMCVSPSHLGLRASRRASRALYLPDELEALAKPDVFQPPENPSILPSGITLHKVFLVKYLTKCGNTLAQIRMAVGLPLHEVVKVRNGVYDQAVKNIRGAGAVSYTHLTLPTILLV